MQSRLSEVRTQQNTDRQLGLKGRLHAGLMLKSRCYRLLLTEIIMHLPLCLQAHLRLRGWKTVAIHFASLLV